ncbi:hypothetical protein ABBQ38_014373 [Trebouxia sp. C0009 RCD-2024]
MKRQMLVITEVADIDIAVRQPSLRRPPSFVQGLPVCKVLYPYGQSAFFRLHQQMRQTLEGAEGAQACSNAAASQTCNAQNKYKRHVSWTVLSQHTVDTHSHIKLLCER